jgi:flavodoxin
MAKIQIIVGTMNGRAWQSAKAVAHVLNHQGHQVRVNEEPGVSDLSADPEEVLLVCCSTTGQGELPPGLYPLFTALDDRAVDLAGRRYGVIALGDSGYQHFAQAGYLMEDALYQAGAKRVGDICTLDARRVVNHPLAAAQWANQWVEALPA